jgi:large subunit ribosomal protein L25
MSEFHIKATIRESVGKSHARRLRRKGEIPCILYGVEKDSVKLSVSHRDFEKLLSETRSVFVVDFGETKQSSVVREIQYHPVKGDMIHVDLLRVKAGQEINVSVPLKFVGTAEGEQMGGVFQELKMDLDITCLPKYLPDNLEIEISELNLGDSIHVSDLNFENIIIKAEPATTICTVAMPRKIEEELPVEGEEEEIEEEEAEPELVGAKKKDEDEEAEESSKE